MSTTERLPQSAAVYCRISEDASGLRLGVRRQEEDCRELAEKRGWLIGEVFVDNDISAWSGKLRPAYQRMLAGIADGSIDGLIVWHHDRLTRTPLELEKFFEVCDRAGLKSMVTVGGDYNLGADDDDRLSARILGAVAHQESLQKSKRIRRKHVELARDGAPMWGVAVPFGFRYDSPTKALLPDGDRAVEVRQMFARYSQGWSLRQITHDLNDRGVIGARGKTQWHSSHVARSLDNAVYAGFRHHKGVLSDGTWEALIDLETWELVRARRLVTKKENTGNRAGTGSNLLSDLLYCVCGARMWRSTSSDPRRSSYDCSKASAKRRGDCPHGGVGAERVERIVRNEFLERMSDLHRDSVGAFKIENPSPPDASKKRQAIERRLGRLIEMQADSSGPASSKVFREKITASEGELREVDLEIAQQTLGDADTSRQAERVKALREMSSDLGAVWDLATRTERNELLKVVIERVVVGEGKPKPVVVQWASWLAP